jgi:hypothetical protein
MRGGLGFCEALKFAHLQDERITAIAVVQLVLLISPFVPNKGTSK